MCGITGCFELKSKKTPSSLHHINAMTDALNQRGPDGGGTWTNKQDGITLGHRRLAIIDTSDAGKQPMTSSCGRYVISYNGEIYNKHELQKELLADGKTFRGHSDTEIILEAWANWGMKRTLPRLIGMFAFGIWDKKLKNLTLVRDRLGIKPLYWGLQNGLAVFASELKAICAIKDFPTSLNLKAVQAFLSYNYVPSNISIYTEIQKLKPATSLTITNNGELNFETYWSLSSAVTSGKQAPFTGTNEEAVEELDSLLTDAVSRRMISDVPLGAFLSGGIDSSAIVALMQKESTKPVKTYSIGFAEAEYDEAQHASQIASHLGTDHTELYVSSQETMDIIPKLAQIYDEPFSDASQIPTYIVSALTRQHVTVALSGDGGDDLFAGYTRYAQIQKMQKLAQYIPQHLRMGLAYCITKLPVSAWNNASKYVQQSTNPILLGDKLHKLATLFKHQKEQFYTRWLTHWGPAPYDIEDVVSHWQDAHKLTSHPIEQMQYTDLMTYLPDDILTKVDRASMATSLEVRVPLLDHRVVEFSWRLPLHLKQRGTETKWILRQLLDRYIPRPLIERPKMGFAAPIDKWLKGPLKDWAEDLLSENTLKKYDLVNIPAVRQKWQEHLSGQRNWQFLLWDILMLQAWCEEWQ